VTKASFLTNRVFWVVFVVLVVIGLFVYGRTLSQDLGEVEQAQGTVAGLQKALGATNTELQECREQAEALSSQLTALQRIRLEVEKAREAASVPQAEELERRRDNQAVPEPQNRHVPDQALDVGRESTEVKLNAVTREEALSSGERHEDVKAVSLTQVRIVINWTPKLGREAVRVRRILESRGAVIGFERSDQQGLRESGIYAPYSLREKAEEVAKALAEVAELPVNYTTVGAERVEVYLGEP
jgi:hypothetical protein